LFSVRIRPEANDVNSLLKGPSATNLKTLLIDNSFEKQQRISKLKTQSMSVLSKSKEKVKKADYLNQTYTPLSNFNSSNLIVQP
jgi:hypothetical protein